MSRIWYSQILFGWGYRSNFKLIDNISQSDSEIIRIESVSSIDKNRVIQNLASPSGVENILQPGFWNLLQLLQNKISQKKGASINFYTAVSVVYVWQMCEQHNFYVSVVYVWQMCEQHGHTWISQRPVESLERLDTM